MSTHDTEILATCEECDQPIRMTDPAIRPTAFTWWRHVRCPQTKFDFDPADVCPECFTVRTTTGACNCA
ncbi:hypothetical protein [Microbacterium imperiale]|uniref:Uncharacterized protein n=1 Tax=Microbacterium imperiale TaxID=33884 RepID=A0A9W6HEL2_9MICO|nr:hypothetical protein [Microbacterium imperiale]MBP2420028.1 primosomal protein N' [Microbacterium imperiale]MDS0198109.1 hypothetical protein [Microbacterium imperiale]BFE40369.1 hypothetical protein GCM10017544_13250 [Microbacterium imperiale]GLJ78655.1 hypothetical protein GCM10017586_03370 [Microbacterium imperiale]